MTDATSELESIRAVLGALEPLDDTARIRVLTYITSVLGLSARFAVGRAASAEDDFGREGEQRDADEAAQKEPICRSFAELYARADPQKNGEKALVAGYWLQVCQGAESFTSASANKELTNLGHRLPNITDAIDSTKNQKPQPILQIKKSGTSRQARKLYKLSDGGIKRIEEMIGG